MAPRDAPALSIELERLAMHALADEYDELNYDLFADRLKRPSLRLLDGEARLGLWEPAPPTISVSRRVLLEQPWGCAVEILKHEMAHQFLWDVLRAEDAEVHGPLFQRICRERGIDAGSAGMPATENAADASLRNKITRLLSLAGSANSNEAEAAMSAAQRLMLKYNIELLQAGEERQYQFLQLGKPTGRIEESQRVLAAILGEFFFVKVLWVGVWRPREGKRGSVLEICGTAQNLELAEYVHAFLSRTAESLWCAHRRENGITKNRDRRRFIAGVMTGFYRKLKCEHGDNEERGLVWLGDPALDAYYRRRFPRIRKVGYVSSRGSDAHAEGQRAGARIVLHRGLTDGPSAGPKLLGRG